MTRKGPSIVTFLMKTSHFNTTEYKHFINIINSLKQTLTQDYLLSLKARASIRLQIVQLSLYHNRISSSRLESTSHDDVSSSNDIPSNVMETDDMLLNKASGSRSSGSFVRNCAADMKSMSFSSSWYRWSMPANVVFDDEKDDMW